MSELDEAYRQSIRYAGAWLAERQSDIGHATYLSKGMEMSDPKPVAGYPVCQLGCIVSYERVAGIDVNAEEALIAGYNRKLHALGKDSDPSLPSDATR